MLPWDPLWRLRHVGYPVSPRGYRGLPAFASLSMAGSGGSGVPLARFSRLFDVLNDQILHADMVPYATGERELAAEYLLYSRPDDLFLYDRGYPAFWLFAFHAQEQSHYCARVRHDFHSEVKAFVADGAKERIVVLTPNTASARQCREGHLPADPLRVRLIRQASLRSRERFWDIRVPKIDSIFDNSLVPRPSWSPGVPPQHRKLVAATHRSPI